MFCAGACRAGIMLLCTGEDLASTSCLTAFAVFAFGSAVSMSSGEQILQPQLSGSPLSSVLSQSKWGKKSAGLRNLFLLPWG